ncbi:MAG: transketolase [Candidatus Ancaeobacter aquaticus]|nr:transketolase [Candidatus Ancaeobacter aquaticus]
MNELVLQKKADQIRSNVIHLSVKNSAGHIAPSLSCVDILVALYYRCMNYDFENPLWEDRDRLIFSKAHGCYGLYAILADKGVIPKKEWDNFYTSKSTLLGCMERRLEYGFEAGCGSLGHGLPLAVGTAFGAHIQKKSYSIFCVVGDGELQEGTTWEALQFAVKYNLSNLVVVIDRNKLQAMDFILNVLDKHESDLINRLKGFGLSPVSCSGHNSERLATVIKNTQSICDKKPKIIIAETVKGFGLKCMENVPKFHFRIPGCEKLII